MNSKLLTSILQRSNELITSESFLTKHRIGNAFTRSRKLSFPNLIYFILQSVHKSISINYSQFLDSFSSDVPPFVSKQAVSKARQGISYKVFIALFRPCVDQFIITHLTCIHGIIFIYMPLMEVQYRFRNQKKTIRYLVEILIKQRKCLRLLLYQCFMM